jgi:uncharacterized protein YcbK (DUF882 family)
LVASIALASLLAQSPHRAAEDTTHSKKARYLEAKTSARGGKPAKAGQRAVRPIWAHNLRTHEIAALTGPSGLESGAEHGSFFRCWFTDEAGQTPAKLVEVLVAAARQFEVRELRIISGFRHPKYNLLLRKKGREVARRSQHTESKAIDFYLPGVSARALYDWALQTHVGGVGFYPVSGFIHVDLGKKRTWRGT